MDILQNRQSGNLPPEKKGENSPAWLPIWLAVSGGSMTGAVLGESLWWGAAGAVISIALGEWAKRHDQKVRDRKKDRG